LSVEIASGVPLVSGDMLALRRALDNLVINALKFTSAGGHVIVRLFGGEDAVTLQVSDTGVGIPNDQLERIFERFYQVDGSTTRRYGGVGLGLALVKEIVEAHGGQVSVTSQVGTGTTFALRLPIA
jgi:signal transduction histidine kinase